VSALVAALVTVPAAVVFSVVSPQVASAGGPPVIGAGSSFAYPALNQWAGEVAALDGDSINYQSQSSVIGLNYYAEGQLNFAASEIGYSTGQSASLPQPPFAPYQYLPDVAGAVCFMYNLPSATGGAITNLRLDAPTLLKIFTGQIANWNDPSITALNPGVALPNQTSIIKVYRTDAAGENYILSDYFTTLYPSDWANFTSTMGTPNGAQAIWPTPSDGSGGQHGIYNISNFQGENGSENAAQYVADSANSITYVETAYAIEHHEPCVSLENPAGAFVQPSEQADAIALTQDQLEPDLEQILTGVFLNSNPLSYPVSAYSYLITQENGQPAPAIGQVLGQYIQFIACQGQQSAGALGYSPIPPNLVVDDYNAVNRINGAAQLPTPNAQNCPNPYLTGQLQLPGEPIQLGTAGAPGSTTGGAGPSAGPGAAGAAAAVSSAGSKGSAGGTQGTTGSGGSSSNAAIQAQIAAAAANAAKVAAQSKHRSSSVQPPGLALSAAAAGLLGKPSSDGLIWLWVLLIVGVFAVLPAALTLVARRRRRSSGAPSEEITT
jgi:phosphate transport system substrate-binding protein